jgi:hypothetical protein
MSLGRGATRDGNQMSGLETRERATAVLLPFIVQDGLQPALGEALPHIGHRRLTHIEGFRQGGCTPALG